MTTTTINCNTTIVSTSTKEGINGGTTSTGVGGTGLIGDRAATAT